MDRGAWRATVHGVAKTQTQLSDSHSLHRHREQTCGLQGDRGEGEGWTGSLKLVDANCYI